MSCYLPCNVCTIEIALLCRYRASSSYLLYFASFSGWILFRRYRASSSNLPHIFFGQGQIVLRRYCASSSYLPRDFVRIHAHGLRKYGVSSDCSLGINMDFPTLMLRRHRTSSRHLHHKAAKPSACMFRRNRITSNCLPLPVLKHLYFYTFAI